MRKSRDSANVRIMSWRWQRNSLFLTCIRPYCQPISIVLLHCILECWFECASQMRHALEMTEKFIILDRYQALLSAYAVNSSLRHSPWLVKLLYSYMIRPSKPIRLLRISEVRSQRWSWFFILFLMPL